MNPAGILFGQRAVLAVSAGFSASTADSLLFAEGESVEPFEAEAIKRASDNQEIEVNTAIAPVLEDLVSEISLSVDYVEHHEGVRVEELLLSGGGVLAPGATGYVGGRLRRVLEEQGVSLRCLVRAIV